MVRFSVATKQKFETITKNEETIYFVEDKIYKGSTDYTRYLPLCGGSLDKSAIITIPDNNNTNYTNFSGTGMQIYKNNNEAAKFTSTVLEINPTNTSHFLVDKDSISLNANNKTFKVDLNATELSIADNNNVFKVNNKLLYNWNINALKQTFSIDEGVLNLTVTNSNDILQKFILDSQKFHYENTNFTLELNTNGIAIEYYDGATSVMGITINTSEATLSNSFNTFSIKEEGLSLIPSDNSNTTFIANIDSLLYTGGFGTLNVGKNNDNTNELYYTSTTGEQFKFDNASGVSFLYNNSCELSATTEKLLYSDKNENTFAFDLGVFTLHTNQSSFEVSDSYVNYTALIDNSTNTAINFSVNENGVSFAKTKNNMPYSECSVGDTINYKSADGTIIKTDVEVESDTTIFQVERQVENQKHKMQFKTDGNLYINDKELAVSTFASKIEVEELFEV